MPSYAKASEGLRLRSENGGMMGWVKPAVNSAFKTNKKKGVTEHHGEAQSCTEIRVTSHPLGVDFANSLMRVEKRKEEHSQKRFLWAAECSHALGNALLCVLGALRAKRSRLLPRSFERSFSCFPAFLIKFSICGPVERDGPNSAMI